MSASALIVRPAARTDFWQRTHYGFQADSGHFLYLDTSTDFECTTEVEFDPVHQYDQAGLMVRVSPECWIKTSVEYEPEGPARLGVVVTNGGYSDWSTQDVDPGLRRVQLRINRSGRDYTVAFRTPDAERWSQLRLACLVDDQPGTVAVGLYACSPTGEGYEARFDYLSVTVPIEK
jgi:uncharacterized protein